MSRSPGRTAVGGRRPPLKRSTVNEHPATFEPDPRVLALLRTIWARRDEIRTQSTKNMIHSFLSQSQRRRLTDAQLDAAANVGRSLAIGFDDPRFDEPTEPAKTPTAQPWGPLPLKPPGHRTA